jgi:hypothetical protein
MDPKGMKPSDTMRNGGSMRRLAWLPWLGAAILFVVLASASLHIREALGNPALLTGWFLFVVLAGLGAFNSRKKLSMVPLGSAALWLQLHVAGGFLALALFWLHARTLWPRGLYEQVLAVCFYAVSASGIIGWLLQRSLPRRLTATGVEILYERIPAEIANLRAQAEALVLECTRATERETLARHYTETLDWFFRRPRFLRNHLFGGKMARAWQRQQFGTIRQYLDGREALFLDRLKTIADYKTDVDFHYAAQTAMKLWLFVHLPLAIATLLLAVWHILLIHIYAV